MKLQLAYDLGTYEELYAFMEEIEEAIDIIEIGTPVILREGVTQIDKVKNRFPDKLIFADLKIMDAADVRGDLKEHQMLGFLMTSLHNFSIKYEVPILAFVQLNRDGINKESTDTASGSDRIIWLCSNFTIYKRKSDEEIAKDAPENGSHKLVPVIARHGEGLADKDYININMIGKYGKIVEGKTAFQLEDGTDYSETLENGNDDIPFA